MTLSRLRKQIDQVDLRLLALLNRRAALALRVGEVKRRHGRPIFDGRRERKILRRLAKANGGPFSKAAIQQIFRGILRYSRRLELSAKR